MAFLKRVPILGKKILQSELKTKMCPNRKYGRLYKFIDFYRGNAFLVWLNIIILFFVCFLVYICFNMSECNTIRGNLLQTIGTVATGFIVVLGWTINKYENYQKAVKEHLKQQISDFYTPIYGLILKYRTVEDFARKSDRFYKKVKKYKNDIENLAGLDDEMLGGKSGRAIDFALDNYTFKIFDDITNIIYSKSYLIDEEENGVPEYIKSFLDHVTMTNILTDYWLKKQEETDFIRFYDFPREFEICIKNKLEELQEKLASIQ